MPVPASLDDLLKLIRKSGMIDEPRLDAYLEKLRLSGPISTDVRQLAGGMVRDSLLTYFQAEQFMLGKWRGFTIGKYKLLERIGFGGMGQVFLSEHMYMRQRVAIKVLPPAKAEKPEALGRFYRAARAAAALDHSNIVRTHDIDQDGNLHFLVMEYVDGSSLLEIIKKKGSMSVTRACHYVWQASQGLDHAFRVGVIHRDIRPGNILVDRFGISKILDMGLARFYQSDDDMLTKKHDEKSVLGTADYVAPEQTINNHDVDVRADIYSLGATFYYLLAGRPPFPGGIVSQKLIAHQTKQPVPIHELRPEVPVGVSAILDRMMAKSIDARFQTPNDVCEELAQFIPTEVDTPPEDEMPILSPAARAAVPMSQPPEGTSGSFRQDAAILRAGMLQRSGRLALPPSFRPPPGFHPVPTTMATASSRSGSGPQRGWGTGSSGNMPPTYFEPPPMVPPLGSAAIPPVPNPARPTNETANLAEDTERTAMPEKRSSTSKLKAYPDRKPMIPVLKIVLESVLVFGLCLVLFAIIRSM
ncbi:MAG: serine/threonine protein kinase [Gemmataceae bacterium]|nr:serine/threonine protein kinase [Gemmataceae bacterium]